MRNVRGIYKPHPFLLLNLLICDSRQEAIAIQDRQSLQHARNSPYLRVTALHRGRVCRERCAVKVPYLRAQTSRITDTDASRRNIILDFWKLVERISLINEQPVQTRRRGDETPSCALGSGDGATGNTACATDASVALWQMWFVVHVTACFKQYAPAARATPMDKCPPVV